MARGSPGASSARTALVLLSAGTESGGDPRSGRLRCAWSERSLSTDHQDQRSPKARTDKTTSRPARTPTWWRRLLASEAADLLSWSTKLPPHHRMGAAPIIQAITRARVFGNTLASCLVPPPMNACAALCPPLVVCKRTTKHITDHLIVFGRCDARASSTHIRKSDRRFRLFADTGRAVSPFRCQLPWEPSSVTR